MLPVEATGSMLKAYGTTTSSEAPVTRYSLTAWQFPFLLDAGDENYIKGFEEIAVRFCDVKDPARPRNHRKLWVRNFEGAAVGHCDLKRVASTNSFAQGICRHAPNVFLGSKFGIPQPRDARAPGSIPVSSSQLPSILNGR